MATKNSGRPPRAAARERTDKSLRAERAKSDESIAEFRQRIEGEADDSVARSRERADMRTTRGRADADSRSANARTGHEMSRAAERRNHDRQVTRERAAADETLVRERSQLDEAVNRQRAKMEGHERLLFRVERALTDQHLSTERSRIDAELARAVRFLAKAVSVHESSRAALGEREAFLHILSHHLKQPLLAIAIAGGQLKADAQAMAGGAETKQHVDAVVANAEEALRLLGDLLEHLARWQAETRTANSRAAKKAKAPVKARAKGARKAKATSRTADEPTVRPKSTRR